MENRNFINGSFVDSISNKNVKVINPANQALVGNINQAMDEEIELAVYAAKKAFEKRILQDMDAKVKSKLLI